MLPCHNGASTLGKALRRPIITAMTAREISTAATESMRSTVSRTGGRALSSATIPSISSPQLRTWHPIHGIVFRPISSTARAPSVATASAIQEDHHLRTEDSYVLASADVPVLGTEANVKIEVVKEEPAKRQTAEELHELALMDPEQDELPETSTSYKIPEDIFRAAKNAEPGSPESFWSHSLYRSPPDAKGMTKKPTVHYCRTIHTTEKVIKDYFLDKKVIGFDIEWQPEAYKLSKARKNVSLVQIACEDRIALLHLALYPRDAKTSECDLNALVAPSLKKILEDSTVTKVGVAIKGDCTRLRKYLDINAQSIFELSHLHKLVRFSKSRDFEMINRSLVSLARQVQEHLHLPLFKGDEVRHTDWSQKLDMAQIMYAASDSYAGLQLYHTLELKRKALDPVPPRPYHAELNKTIRFEDGIEMLPEKDDPDAKVILRTRKYNKKVEVEAEAESAEVVKIEDLSPTTELSHSFFSSSSTNSLLGRFRRSTVEQGHSKSPNQSRSFSQTHDSPPSIAKLPPSELEQDSLREAETSTNRFIQSRQGSRADISHLPLPPSQVAKRGIKTYFLWLENPTRNLDDIGAMLRKPALTARSVAKMVLEAISINRLPYEKSRLREVLKIYAMTAGGNYIKEHPYFHLAEDSGYNEQREKEIEKEMEEELRRESSTREKKNEIGGKR